MAAYSGRGATVYFGGASFTVTNSALCRVSRAKQTVKPAGAVSAVTNASSAASLLPATFSCHMCHNAVRRATES